MRPKWNGESPATGIAIGFAILFLRLVAVFAVIGAGAGIWHWLGSDWFYVYVAAMIALRIHLELRWIERMPDEALDGSQEQGRAHPFRKR